MSAFQGSNVEFAIEMPKFLANKDNKRIDELITKFIPMMDYAQAPLLKILKYFGKSLSRLIGLGPLEHNVVKLKGQLVTMQDGAKLPTDIYFPKFVYENKFKAPTILVRLPYWKNMVSILGYIFSSKGYVTVLQDMRGCASSIPYSTLALTFYVRSDGLDTLRWLTKRWWYNGKIGMWGISFLGVTQLGVSWDNQNLVSCISPMQCSYNSVLYHPGGLNPIGMGTSIYSLILGITLNENPSVTSMVSSDFEKIYKNPLLSLYNDPIESPKGQLKLSELAKIQDAEELTSLLNEKFKLNLKFNEKNKGDLEIFMKRAILKREIDLNYEYLPYAFGFDGSKIETPMLVIASQYDMFVEQFFRDLKLIQKNSPDYFKKNFKMVICPGAHGGMNFLEFQDFPPKPLINTKEMLSLFQNFMPFWWYDYWLKGIAKDLTKVPPIRMFILNKGNWRNLSRWPPKSEPMKLYLHSKGSANSRFGDGRLLEEKPNETQPPDEYDFNPANPVVTRGGRFLFLRSGGLNQTHLEERKDILCYTSNKLTKDLEIIGEVKIVLYASSSAKDTDYTVKLVDVYNDKKAINIVDSGIRARFRNGFEQSSLIEPNKIYKYEFLVGSTGIYFPKGHKIRIEISSSNFPRFDVNSNLGGEQNEKGYITAHQKIFHDSESASYLILPVFKAK